MHSIPLVKQLLVSLLLQHLQICFEIKAVGPALYNYIMNLELGEVLKTIYAPCRIIS